jgi:hypothetical protein
MCCCFFPRVQAFDHPSIDSIATFLTDSQLLPAASAAGAQAPPTVSPAAAHAAAMQLVTAAVQDVLGSASSSSSLDPSAPLMSVGLNSTMAVTLAASIEAAVGNPVPATLVS